MYPMTDHQFYLMWGEALTTADRAVFISDWSLSSLFLDPDSDSDVPAGLPEQLGRIWDAAHLSIADIRAATGLSQAAFGERLCIPRRTVQNWECRGGCPDYVRLLIAQACGLFHR